VRSRDPGWTAWDVWPHQPQLGIPTLVFVLTDDALGPAAMFVDAEHAAHLNGYRVERTANTLVPNGLHHGRRAALANTPSES